jgi:hypothetical protein
VGSRRQPTRDRFVANSQHIAAAIMRCYGRDAEVVYPPVDVERFSAAANARTTSAPRTDYITVSRLVPTSGSTCWSKRSVDCRIAG